MEAAVRAFLETKFGPSGTYRGGAEFSSWRQPKNYAENIPPPDEAAVQATISFCRYVHGRYGRFPSYTAPFRTVIGFQVCRVDAEFYRQFYQPEAVCRTVGETSAARGS